MSTKYSGRAYVFQQDGAPAHTALATQKFLSDTFQSFWPKTHWPPYSPDLNPLDFSIWARVASEACSSRHPNLDSLQAAVNAVWNDLPAKYVKNTCSSFRRRLELVIEARGSVIEN